MAAVAPDPDVAAATTQPAVRPRTEVAGAILDLFPRLKERLAASIPDEVRESLATVTWHQVEALHQMQAFGGAGATMSEIARQQRCALSSATALVDRLLAQGLAGRRPDATDRRVIRIAPTAVGEELLTRFQRGRHRIAMQAFAPLSDEDLEVLLHLFQKIAAGTSGDDSQEVAHD